MRSAVSASQNAANTAGAAAGAYNSTAGNVAANLIPYATRQLANPSGMSQRDIGAQLTAALAGSGGATSALTGAANAEAGRTRNPVGFSAALDAASRQAGKTVAGVGEQVASNNANVKLQQQQQAGNLLSGLYGSASRAGVGEGEVQSSDIKDMIAANQTGWFQNMNDLIRSISGGAQSAASVKQAWG